MHLLPTYLRTQSPHHARFLAIDVTIPAPPPSSDASTTAATATTQHHKAERAKFSITGNRSYVRVFEDLVNQQILLLPFTVDHLGGIGTLGYRLLFGHDPHKAPQPTTTKPSNRHSLLLYNAAYGTLAPTDLLRRADENWTRSHPYSRFGPSYHTSLPSHWAQQLLGLNLTTTLHNHFRKRIRTLQSRHSRTQSPSSRTQYTPRGRPFYTTPYTSRLRTMRTHEDL
jgi:hypothetical protein